MEGPPAPVPGRARTSIGARLRAAREERGIDLFRAERDTKIRVRHLQALEDGDHAQLPGPVYGRGFLRNYAAYLGLDPDVAVADWRDEVEAADDAEPAPMAVPPQPIADPRSGFTFTPGVAVAIVLAILAALFAAYVAVQLMRFSQVPVIRLAGERIVELQPNAQTVLLRGTAGPRSVVSIRGATGELLTTTTADEEGAWLVELNVGKGRNDFTLVAKDPDTGRESEVVPVIVTVPVPGITSPTAAPTPSRAGPRSGAGEVRLTVTAPDDRVVIENGAIAIRGTTDAPRVSVRAVWLGPPGGGEGGIEPDNPPAPFELAVEDGAFRGGLLVPTGRWKVTIATGPMGVLAGALLERTLDIRQSGVVVGVTASGGEPTIAVWSDGEIAQAARTLRNGETAFYAGRRTVYVKTSDGSVTTLNVSGDPYGPMGTTTEPIGLMMEKGKLPRSIE